MTTAQVMCLLQVSRPALKHSRDKEYIVKLLYCNPLKLDGKRKRPLLQQLVE